MKNNPIITGLAAGAGFASVLFGAYFLYGSKDAVKNRKKAKTWLLHAKDQASEKLEKISETVKNNIIK